MPVGCDQIRFLDLPPEALNALMGAEPVLDFNEGFSLRYSKSREALSDVNELETEGVLGFSAPPTPTNDAILCEYGTPATLNNNRRFYSVSVISAGVPAAFTRLVCKGRLETGDWDLELRRAPGHWAELGSQLYLNQIDYGTFDFGYPEIEDNWANGAVYTGTYDPTENNCTYWSPDDYGGWCDRRELQQGSTVRNKFLGIEDLRPKISLPYILKRGACQFGWTIDGPIFDSEYVRRLWVYALSPTYYDADKIGGRVRLRTFTRSNFTYGAFAPYPAFEEKVIGDTSEAVLFVPATPSIGYVPGIRNISQLELRWAFSIIGYFTNQGASPIELNFYVQQLEEITGVFAATGEILSASEDEVLVTIAPGETKYINISVEATLRRGIYAALCFGGLVDGVQLYYEKGLFAEMSPVNQCFMMTAGTLTIADMVATDRTWLDELKGFLHLIRGRLETDFTTKTITVHPAKKADLYGTTVPGFLLEEEADLDFSDNMVPDSVKITPVNPTLKRFTQIEFADSTDAYIDSLNLLDPAHARKITNGAELPNEVDSIQNPLYQPTLEGQIDRIGSGQGGRQTLPWLPRLWDNTDGNRSFSIKHRIFFAFGLVRQKNPNLNAQQSFQYCGFNWGNPANDPEFDIDFFGYATQLRTQLLDPTPDIDGSVVFSSQPENLFVQFYLGISAENKGGTNVDFLQFLTPQDYANFNFRRFVRVPFQGRPLQVELLNISDHEMCGDIATPVNAFHRPRLTECCELPCGCQFTTCDYFQDFGIFLRQSTLDTMRVSSFVVDGIELLTAPLPLGEINIIDVGGNPYVTNLVDTLNSIAAPYFSFGYSQRLDSQERLRFFTLKRPACYSFKIVITADGDEVYRYTQDTQEQMWFGASWSPLGYGGEFAAPDNCVTIPEF